MSVREQPGPFIEIGKSQSVTVSSTSTAALTVSSTDGGMVFVDDLDDLYGTDRWMVVVEGLAVVSAGRTAYVGVACTQSVTTAGTPTTVPPGTRSVRNVVTAAEIKAAGLTAGTSGRIWAGGARDAGANQTLYSLRVSIRPYDPSITSTSEATT